MPPRSAIKIGSNRARIDGGRGRTVTFVRSIDRSSRPPPRRRFHLARNALSRTSSSSPREWNQVSGTQTIFKQIGFHRTPHYTLFQTLPQTCTRTRTYAAVREPHKTRTRRGRGVRDSVRRLRFFSLSFSSFFCESPVIDLSL